MRKAKNFFGYGGKCKAEEKEHTSFVTTDHFGSLSTQNKNLWLYV